jgi:hypothetical protein
MKKPTRQSDGLYHVNGKTYKILIGSRHQVWNGTAFKTEGQLTKKHLMMNKWGRIVSRKKHFTANKEKRLEKAGYKTKKGVFNLSKKHSRKHKSRKA